MSTDEQTDLMKSEPAPPPVVTNGEPNVANLLQLTIEKGLDAPGAVDAVAKLIDLQGQLEARAAEKSFNRAMVAFKQECPRIPKNKSTKKTSSGFGYKYADLETISGIVDKILLSHGLTYNFDNEFADGTMTAICIVRHVDGHSATSRFTGPIDTQAKMNVIQQAGSAGTYVHRYALVSALGLTTCDDDNDGAGPESMETIDENQQATIREWIDETGADQEKFLKYLGVEKVADIQKRAYGRAIADLKRKGKQS